MLLQVVLNFSISLVFAVIQIFFFKKDFTVRTASKAEILVVMLLLFSIKSQPVRYTLFVMAIVIILWAVIEVMFAQWGQVDVMTLLTNLIIFLVCLLQLSMMMFRREMQMRKQYNRDRIIDVEIEKNDELLSKLVPVHVLRGLKNDERIVEQIDNVTLLYTDMVGFTAFSKNVKRPQEVVQLLSQLFSKFDQLVDSKGVYKVHTIGDCYVVMGYTGKVNKYRRNEQIQVEEAYRVVQVGFEMIEIIRNVRETSEDASLKNLDMRIGIHTGKIVGGIIGTNVVRYDIFGNDVLIANKMESNGVDSQVVISEATF